LSCAWGLFVDRREGPEAEFRCGEGEVSLDLGVGVGIAVDTRLLGGSTLILLGSGTSTGSGGPVTLGSRILESEEDSEVNVERLEGVVGSTIGLGETRTSATTSSKFVSVVIVDADIIPKSIQSPKERQGIEAVMQTSAERT
jgi:hypothetical protein